MSVQQRRIKTIISSFIVAGVCLLGFPTAAQQFEPQGSVSDADFMSLQQQIKELKNPTFRAFLRMQLLSWESAEASATRRRAAMELATQGVTDLCEHQDQVWTPTASWLHEGFLKQIKTLQSPEEAAVATCVVKTAPESSPAKDLSSGFKMLRNPETSAAGLSLAKSAILSGQVSGEAMLGELLRLQTVHSPHLPELLSALLSVEEKQPGTLPLRLMPFFTSLFLDKSNPPELATRYVFVAVRSTRVSEEEFAKVYVRGPIATLLNGIAGHAKQLTPAVYPEIANRLRSLNANAPNTLETRLAAEERIQKATDQLEQLISEANSVSHEQLKQHFLARASRVAKEQGQLTRSVDLAMKIANDGDTWSSAFLLEIVALAVTKKSPYEAIYAVSRMTPSLKKAEAFRLIGEYYGASGENVRSKPAFTQSAKLLNSLDNSNEKVKTSLTLAESVLKYEPADAYEIFRDAVKAMNNLPSPKQGDEKTHYLSLWPVARDLIRSFRALAIHENQTATSLAAEIKSSELRVAALSGVYSSRSVTK
jgi:hypothetical protein